MLAYLMTTRHSLRLWDEPLHLGMLPVYTVIYRVEKLLLREGDVKQSMNPHGASDFPPELLEVVPPAWK